MAITSHGLYQRGKSNTMLLLSYDATYPPSPTASHTNMSMVIWMDIAASTNSPFHNN
jgi:hypothetical protein